MANNSIDMDADYDGAIVDGKTRLSLSKVSNGMTMNGYEDLDAEAAASRKDWAQNHIDVRNASIAELTTQIAKFQAVIDAINNAQ